MKKKIPHAEYIGHVATFYIPSTKLDMTLQNGFTARKMLHDYCVANFNAYTHEISKIQGYWVNKGILIQDDHERYEVSFKGKEKVDHFVDFLSQVCFLIEEESIYLTMGYNSWLVIQQLPKD